MTQKETDIARLSENYKELDGEGKDALLKIGEKIFTVTSFVSKEISALKDRETAQKE